MNQIEEPELTAPASTAALAASNVPVRIVVRRDTTCERSAQVDNLNSNYFLSSELPQMPVSRFIPSAARDSNAEDTASASSIAIRTIASTSLYSGDLCSANAPQTPVSRFIPCAARDLNSEDTVSTSSIATRTIALTSHSTNDLCSELQSLYVPRNVPSVPIDSNIVNLTSTRASRELPALLPIHNAEKAPNLALNPFEFVQYYRMRTSSNPKQ